MVDRSAEENAVSSVKRSVLILDFVSPFTKMRTKVEDIF